MRAFSVAAICLLTAACGFSPVYMQLSPRIDLPESRIGRGRSIALEVVDARDDREIGRRQHGLVAGSRIELTEPAEASLRRSLVQALSAQDFLVGGAAPAGARLRVELRELIYDPEGAIGARINTAVTIAAVAENGGRRYAQTYRVTDQDRQFIASSEHFSGGRLSAMTAEALRRMLTDRQLRAIIAR